MKKPRIYNRLEQQEWQSRRKPHGMNLALAVIDDSIAPWREILQRDIARGDKNNQCIAQTVIKVLEKTKEDILSKIGEKNGKIPRTS